MDLLDGETALHGAAEEGCIDVVDYLLSIPELDPLVRNKRGKTPAYKARANGHDDIADMIRAEARGAQGQLGQRDVSAMFCPPTVQCCLWWRGRSGGGGVCELLVRPPWDACVLCARAYVVTAVSTLHSIIVQVKDRYPEHDIDPESLPPKPPSLLSKVSVADAAVGEVGLR